MAGGSVHNAGDADICPIGKERTRRAAAKIPKEYPDAVLDSGFRVYRLEDFQPPRVISCF